MKRTANCYAKGMTIQVFGTNKSQDTKKALRFFKERGLSVHFVDLSQRQLAPAELRRFTQAYGVAALVDTGGKAYHAAGLAYLQVPEQQMTQKLLDDPKLLKQPLIRAGQTLAVGWDEARWRQWYKEAS
jgi:arsenate reductase-like glutaredoxin family protein